MTFLRGWHPLAVDSALAAVVAVMLSATVLVTPQAGALDLAAVLVGSLSLIAWRRAPLVPLVVGTVSMLVFSVHAQPGPPAAFPVMMAVFAAVWAGHRLLPALASAVFLGVSLAVDLATATGQSPKDIV
jgi:hypothetical protein